MRRRLARMARKWLKAVGTNRHQGCRLLRSSPEDSKMADLLSRLMDLFSAEEPPELLGRRSHQSSHVILAGLHGRETLPETDTVTLRRELRMLLKLERIHAAAAKINKEQQVLQYML